MKQCEKCWSGNIKNTANMIICKDCGHSKISLNVVVNSEFDSGLYGKRLQSFITEKSAAKAKVVQDPNKPDTQWKFYVSLYQKTLKSAAISFIKQYALQQKPILDNLKAVWTSYLTAWNLLNIPLKSVFTSPEESRVKQQQSPFIMSQEQQLREQNYSPKRRRSSTIVGGFQVSENQHLSIVSDLKSEKPSKAQLQAYIRNLTQSMTLNSHPYFKKLFGLKVELPQGVVTNIKNLYVRRLYYLHESRKSSTKEKLSFLKHNKMHLKIQWLRKAVTARNQANSSNMSQDNLMTYIFMFDLLQYRLNIKSPENKKTLKDMIAKYTQSKKYGNSVINIILGKLRLTTHYQDLYGVSEKQKGLPPSLNFNLIYSFIQLALLKSGKVYFINEIIEHSDIETELWDGTDYLKVNSAPTIEYVRKTSIDLFNSTDVSLGGSLRHLWIERLCREAGIQKYQPHVKVMAKTLIVNPDWVVNEDLECLALIAIFVKMMVNMDGQGFLAKIDLEDLTENYSIVENQLYKAVVQYVRKTQVRLHAELGGKAGLNMPDLVSKLSQSNSQLLEKRKFQSVSDLSHISRHKLVQLSEADQRELLDSLDYKKYKEIFHGGDTTAYKFQQRIHIEFKNQDPKPEVEFRLHLNNELQPVFSHKAYQTTAQLPCKAYEIITDFRSNYIPLDKHEYMNLLGTLSEHKCTIDQLYPKIQELERHLIIFQTP